MKARNISVLVISVFVGIMLLGSHVIAATVIGSNISTDGIVNSTNINFLESVRDFLWKGNKSYSFGGSNNNGYLTLGNSTSTVVSVDDGAYSSFPGLTVLPNGSLMVAYRKGTNHLDNGKLYYKISRNQGATWGSETLLYDTNNAGWEARDPEITILRNGTLALTFFKANSTHTIDSVYVMFGNPSATDQFTWTSPILVANSFTQYSAVSSKIIELSNGDLLLPIYGRNTGDTVDTLAVVRSSDDGYTWTSQVNITDQTTNSYNEAAGVVLNSGRIVLIIRNRTNSKGYYMSYSDDNGVTWSTPQIAISTSVVGRPTLAFLPSGGLFFIGRGSLGTYYAMSWDSGTTWTPLLKLHNKLNMYSSAVLLSGGELAVVYAYENSTSVCGINFVTFYDGYGTFSQGYASFKKIWLDNDLNIMGKSSVSTSTLLSVSNSVATPANTTLLSVASTTNGTATSTAFIILPSGYAGFGTSSPTTHLQITSATSNATSTMELGKSGQNKGSCLVLYDTSGNAVYVYVAAGAATFTLSSTSCK